ncbi:cytochrome c [Halomonas desiderata]|uniref:Cytochrome c n=2 Tax=Oceanospirillales TaxID=135619 RepID=A0ABS9BCV5_9GAMM|nr:cytochrome c [Halomonas desiderata]MCE8045052.1 cytochrome c [Halomonas desiderata]MCE8049617.1 cytochrome c [Halomonas desiderata]NIC39198.1 cytochrome c [Halomonas desiderata]
MADDAPLSHDASQPIEGEQIYQQHCASCHGIDGEGMPNWQRPNAMGELPAPPHGPEGHTWKHSDAMLYRMVSEGWRDPWNETERLTMPAFEDVLTPAEIRSVINYLKTLWTPEQQRHQAEESEGASFPMQSE